MTTGQPGHTAPRVREGGVRSAYSIRAVLPAYNEAENLRHVITELATVLETTAVAWEILVVDDGSTDGTPLLLQELATEIPSLRWIRFGRNTGKSEALRAGLSDLTTDLVLLMDADGQDDPADLPVLLREIDRGVDLVTGRRARRADGFVKRATSRLYNWTTARLTGVEGSDFNSGFKLMRARVAESVDLYGEMHRYIPVLAVWRGFKVREVDVNNRWRLRGHSKFGRNRFWRGLLDLITVRFLTAYDSRPFHLIGGAGLILMALGGSLLAWMLVMWCMKNPVGSRPALLIGVMLTVVGVQLLSVGLLAELMVSFLRRRTLAGPTMVRGPEPER